MRPGALRRAVLTLAFAVGMPAHANAGTPELFDIRFQSSLLSQFFKQPVEIGASVLLPDSYYKEPSRRYPVIYVVPAFEGTDVVSEYRARLETPDAGARERVHRRYLTGDDEY